MHINEVPPEDGDIGPPVEATDLEEHPSGGADGAIKDPDSKPEPKKRRGQAWLAWIVIAAVVCFIVFGKQLLSKPEESSKAKGSPLITRMSAEWQAKFLVGYSTYIQKAELPEKQKADFKKELIKSLDQFNTGALQQRLAATALTAELDSPENALKQLDSVQKLVDKSEFEQPEELLATMDSLKRLYRDYSLKKWSAPSLSPADNRRVKQQLGFSGELALAPAKGDAKTREAVIAKAQLFSGMLVGIGSAVCAWGAMGILIAALWLLAILISSGFDNPFSMKLQAGSPHGGVYAETFAIWLGGFVLTSILMGLVRQSIDLPFFKPPALMLQIVIFLGSLIVLVWPVLRGIPWKQVRQDIGWTMKNPLADTFIGPFVHSASMPLIGIGMVIMIIGATLTAQMVSGAAADPLKPVELPSHPITGWLASAGVYEIMQIFFVACFCAPVVEETMFRGVLYKHLRDSTSRWSMLGSVVFSALLNSFVFAAIHPQGVLAIPLLMSLAIGFTLAREWRGSLIAPMIAHGVNNAAVMTLSLLLFRS